MTEETHFIITPNESVGHVFTSCHTIKRSKTKIVKAEDFPHLTMCMYCSARRITRKTDPEFLKIIAHHDKMINEALGTPKLLIGQRVRPTPGIIRVDGHINPEYTTAYDVIDPPLGGTINKPIEHTFTINPETIDDLAEVGIIEKEVAKQLKRMEER